MDGHLLLALIILSRKDVDLSIRDKEGNTCIDLLYVTSFDIANY